MLDTSAPVVDKSLKPAAAGPTRYVTCPKCKKKTAANKVEDRGTYLALKAFCPTQDNEGDEGSTPHGPICNVDPKIDLQQPTGFTDLQLQTLARMMAALLPPQAPAKAI